MIRLEDIRPRRYGANLLHLDYFYSLSWLMIVLSIIVMIGLSSLGTILAAVEAEAPVMDARPPEDSAGTMTPVLAGSIRAVADTKEPIKRVWAIERRARKVTTSKGKVHDIGMYTHTHEGKVVGKKILIEKLPVPGRYDLKLETKSGGIICGWDANVPESDYVDDPPLEEKTKQKIFKKLGAEDFSAFSDQMWVLDIQGNIQNAVVLVMKLRTRPFVGGGYKPGEWVWRIERWQWEDPDEHTWVPYQKHPFYALIRERLYENQLRDKRIIFAGHLGGIILTGRDQTVELGTVKVPCPSPGVLAVNPDGSGIRPVTLKGSNTRDWLIARETIKPEHDRAGGAK